MSKKAAVTTIFNEIRTNPFPAYAVWTTPGTGQHLRAMMEELARVAALSHETAHTELLNLNLLPAEIGRSTERKFRRLADQWRLETLATSSITDIVLHPAYQQIIGMGSKALPFILRDLESEGGYWFWALQAITGHSLQPEGKQMSSRELRDAWISWGRERGLL